MKKGKYGIEEEEEKENGYAIIFNRFSINFIILDNKKTKRKSKKNRKKIKSIFVDVQR